MKTPRYIIYSSNSRGHETVRHTTDPESDRRSDEKMIFHIRQKHKFVSICGACSARKQIAVRESKHKLLEFPASIHRRWWRWESGGREEDKTFKSNEYRWETAFCIFAKVQAKVPWERICAVVNARDEWKLTSWEISGRLISNVRRKLSFFAVVGMMIGSAGASSAVERRLQLM